MSTGTRARTGNAAAPKLAAYWFGIQLVWGAVLGISLQARCVQLAGPASLATYGEISALGALTAAVTQIPIGIWSDTLRRRGNNRCGFYVAGALGGAAAIVAFYLAATPLQLLATFIALQFALNLAIGPYQAILPDTVESSRLGGASAWMAAMQSAGNAAGALIATILGSRMALGVAIGIALLGTCAITVIHVRALPLRAPTQERTIAVTRTLGDLFVSRAFVYVGFYTILGYLFFYVRNALSPSMHVDATTITGIAILLFTLVGTAGAAAAAKPSDRLDERLVVTIGGGIVAAASLALASLHVIAGMPVAILFAGVGWGIFLCADWAFACRLLPPDALATTMGIWNLAVVGPQMIAPVIATAILARFGALATTVGPRIAFLVASVEILIGIAWIWRLPGNSPGK